MPAMPANRADSGVRSLSSVAVPVVEMERAVAFYADLLGCYVDARRHPRPIHPRNSEVLVQPEQGPGLLLTRADGAERLWFGRAGVAMPVVTMEIRGDLLQLHATLSAAGAMVSAVSNGGAGAAFTVADPDGNLLRLWHP